MMGLMSQMDHPEQLISFELLIVFFIELYSALTLIIIINSFRFVSFFFYIDAFFIIVTDYEGDAGQVACTGQPYRCYHCIITITKTNSATPCNDGYIPLPTILSPSPSADQRISSCTVFNYRFLISNAHSWHVSVKESQEENLRLVRG